MAVSIQPAPSPPEIFQVTYFDGYEQDAITALNEQVDGRTLVALPDPPAWLEWRREGMFRFMRFWLVGPESSGGQRWENRIDCACAER